MACSIVLLMVVVNGLVLNSVRPEFALSVAIATAVKGASADEFSWMKVMSGCLAFALGALLASTVPILLPAWFWVGVLLLGGASVVGGWLLRVRWPLVCWPFGWLGPAGSPQKAGGGLARRCGGRWLLLVGSVIAGLGFGGLSACRLMDSLVPEDVRGYNLAVTGVVTGLPEQGTVSQQFEFETTTGVLAVQPVPLAGADPAADLAPIWPCTLRLSWYHGAEVRAGEKWTLTVRLRRPRGLVNPGGFDYQRWLLSKGICATGYVVAKGENRRLEAPSPYRLAVWRDYLRQRLQGVPVASHTRGYLQALLLGDRSAMDSASWQLLQGAGLNHLLAISGLHIGLSAVLGYGIGLFFARSLCVIRPAQQWLPLTPVLMSLLLATMYCLLSGFALSAQRALVMVVLVLLARACSRAVSPWVCLGWAFVVCVLMNPLAAYEGGFWLSFGAVAILLAGGWFIRQGRGYWPALLRVQWLVLVGMLLPLLWLGLPLAPLAPLANLLMVPLVSLLVVPLLLLGALLAPVPGALADYLWLAAGWALELGLSGLELLRGYLVVHYLRPELPSGLLVATGFAVLMWLLPLPGLIRCISLPALVSLILLGLRPAPSGALEVTVLDVGQGLAVVVRQAERALLFDTGPSMGETMSAGRAVILPFLRHQGVTALERLIVSHNDDDHRGGLEEVLQGLPALRLQAGEPEKIGPLGALQVERCDEAEQWQWLGSVPVTFALLKAGTTSGSDKGNNRSCVLLIEVAGVRILLPGDIESRRERELLLDPLLEAGVDVLVAPHHGSKTSSSERFLRQLQPRWVIYSAGFQNRYHHPHPDIVRRYDQLGVAAFNTATSGAVSLRITSSEAAGETVGKIEFVRARWQQRRFWFSGE